MYSKEKFLNQLPFIAAWGALSVIFAACIAALWIHGYIGLNNDNMTLLYQTKRMLAGATLYKDLFEVAPPFIHFLYTVPVALANVTDIPVKYTLDSFVTFLVVVSLGLCAHIAYETFKNTTHTALKTAWIIAPAMIALCVYSFFAEVFSDREHLTVVLALPYLFLHAPFFQSSKLSRIERFLIGFMIGVGSVLKPYYLILPVFVCLYTLARRRSFLKMFTSENWGVAAACAAFGITIYFITPGYVQNVLPVALETYKGALPQLSARLKHLRAEYFPYVPWFIAGFAVMALIASARKNIANILYLCTVLAATTLIYSLNSGWFYTIYPFYAVSFMVMVYLFYMVVTTPLPSIYLTPATQRLVLGIFAVFIMIPAWSHFTGKFFITHIDSQIERQSRTGYPKNYTRLRPEIRRTFEKYLTENNNQFALYGTSTWATNLLQISKNAINESRFDCLWQLADFVNKEKTDQVKFTKNFLPNALADDLRNKKPGVVFVENSPEMRRLPKNFDIVSFFKKYPSFNNEWKNYRLAEKVDVCSDTKTIRCSYGIYVRKSDKDVMMSEGHKPNHIMSD
ncbi:MAG: hypothetical protein U1E36_02670 [Rickettsiales bacterium]